MRLLVCALVSLLGCSSGSLTGADAGPRNEAAAHDAFPLDRLTDGDVTTPEGFCAEWMAIWSQYPGCSVAEKGSGPQPFGCARFVASIRAGRVSWDLASAETCLLPIKYGMGAECGYDWGRCSGTTPQVELGGACSPYAVAPECKGDAFCFATAPGACTGTCAPRRKEGEICVRHADCAAGLACDGTGRCSSLPVRPYCSYISLPPCQRADASCAPSGGEPVGCGWGTICDPATVTCRSPAKPGEACDSSGDAPCGGDASARCDVASKTCFICLE